MRPLVVIGIPTCESAPFIDDTLASALDQRYPNVSILVSDDASGDGTCDRIAATAAGDRRVEVTVQPQRRGWIGNCNTLLAQAKGDYFCWLPHDDRMAPDYVAAMVDLLESRQEAVLAYSGATMAERSQTGGAVWPGSGHMLGSRGRLHRALRYLHWSEREKGWPFHGLMRLSALRATGGLRALHFAADNVLVFHLALLGDFVEDPRPLCHKRLHAGSVSTTYGHRLWEWDEYFRAHHQVIRQAAIGATEAAVLHSAVLARRMRAFAARPLGNARRAWRRRLPL